MITLIYSLVDEDGQSTDPVERVFEDYDEMYRWVRGQDEHPTLSINVIEVREK